MIENFFIDTKTYRDSNFKAYEGKEGWIDFEKIYNLDQISQFHDRLSLIEVYRLMKLSAIVDIKAVRYEDDEGTAKRRFIIRKSLN